MKLRLFVLLLFVATVGLATAFPATHKALSKEEILELARNYVPSERLADLVQQYGINFTPGEDFFKALREAGGEEVLVKALRAAKPARPLDSAAAPEASDKELRHLLARGAQFKAQKQYPEAEKEYRAARRLAPERADIHFSLGYVLLEQKKWDGAITENREALHLRPEIPAAYNNLGSALYHKGELRQAQAAYREALHLKPNYPKAHYGLGLVLEKAGDLPAAVREFHAACKLEPENTSFCATYEKLSAKKTASGPGTEQQPAAVGENPARGSAGGGRAGVLVGAWANSDSFGDVVDAGTGAYIRGAYTGEAYRFQQDGTFWHLTVGSGTVVSGAAVQQGDYNVQGKVLTMSSKTESWTPNPSHSGQRPAYKNKPVDEVTRFEFSVSGSNTLNLTELPYKTHSTFHRTRKSQ